MNMPDALSVSDPCALLPLGAGLLPKSGLALLGQRQNVLHPDQPAPRLRFR